MSAKCYILGLLLCGITKVAQADTNALRTVFRTAMSKLDDPYKAMRLTGQAMAESGGRTGAVSRAGAKGIFQFMPNTAKAVGLTNPNDPVSATLAAIKHMGGLETKYNRPWLALAAYNAGTGRVSHALEQGTNWMRHLPAETKAYPGRVQAATQQLLGSGFLDQEIPRFQENPTLWWKWKKAFPTGEISDKLEMSRKAWYAHVSQQLGLQ
jgi:hypothetical protein